MRSDIDAFLLLGRCLGVDDSVSAVSGLRQALLAPGIDWLCVAARANDHLVAPALWASLRRKGCEDALPADLQVYLAEVYGRNAQRNEAIRRQAAEAVAALNHQGIAPIVLKGGLRLFDPGFDMAARMMADIDLLVPYADYRRGLDALQALGYIALDAADPPSAHSCTFSRAGILATIDLHRDLGRQRRLLTPDEAWSAAVPLEVDGLRLMALSPTHRVLHNVVNSVANGSRYRMYWIGLRQLHDLATLCQRHADGVDWHAIRQHMARGGEEHALHALFCLANRLLELPLPAEIGRTRRAHLYVRCCLLQLRRGPVMYLTRLWGRATHPFSRVRMDYLYGGGRSPLHLAASRLRHAWALFRRHRGAIGRTISRDFRTH